MKPKYGDVSVALDGYVATLEVDRPPNNHVSVDLMRDLADALLALDDDKDCRAVVLATAGRVFCGGADLVTPQSAAHSGVSDAAVTGNPLSVEAVRL